MLAAGHVPLLSLDQSKRLSKKQSLPVSAWSLLPIFFSCPASHGALSSAMALSGMGGSRCLEPRLLPQPRPIGYKFLAPFKSLGPSPPTLREAGLRAGVVGISSADSNLPCWWGVTGGSTVQQGTQGEDDGT